MPKIYEILNLAKMSSCSFPYLDISTYVSAITFNQKTVDSYWSRLSTNACVVLKENVVFSQSLRVHPKEDDLLNQDAHTHTHSVVQCSESVHIVCGLRSRSDPVHRFIDRSTCIVDIGHGPNRYI